MIRLEGAGLAKNSECSALYKKALVKFGEKDLVKKTTERQVENNLIGTPFHSLDEILPKNQ